MEKEIVKSKQLSKVYGNVEALKPIDIKIRRGEIYGLVGDNGAGKTTFLKLLTGQIFPTSGELELFGKYLEKDLNKERKRVGALIEEAGYYPQLSVRNNLEYFRIQRGIADRTSVQTVLKEVGMEEHQNKLAKNLSLGMKQRLGLAIALLGNPEFLILDEPINGLDPTGIIEMRNLLRKLNQEKNITMIISSHILTELEQIATIYGFLSKGRLMEQISVGDLREKCKSYIEIKVTDPEKYVTLLEKRMGNVAYKVLPDSIQIYDSLEQENSIEEYSRLALEAGVGILSLNEQKQSLEQYYLNLKMGGNQRC